MNVLEIYCGYAWWFEAADDIELAKLRQVAASKKNGSDRWHEGRAYFMGGDPSTFNLRRGTFDEVRVIPPVSAAKRRAFEKCARAWLKPGGVLAYGTTQGMEKTRLSQIWAAGAPEALVEPLARCENIPESSIHSVLPAMGSLGLL